MTWLVILSLSADTCMTLLKAAQTMSTQWSLHMHQQHQKTTKMVTTMTTWDTTLTKNNSLNNNKDNIQHHHHKQPIR